MAKLGYIKEPGILNLSYSRLNTLHSCARKFELAEKHESGERTKNVHTEFGHAYAMGIQTYFQTKNTDRAILAAMAAWDLEDLWERPESRSSAKSFEQVLLALDSFFDCIYPQYFEDRWKLADLSAINMPAIEPLIYIDILGQFAYQMHIDLIIQNVETNNIAVLELKTTEKVVHPAIYRNSSQTSMYSVVTDDISKRLQVRAHPEVFYIAYNPKQQDNFGHNVFNFPMPARSKIDAINTVLLECERIKRYEELQFYPKNGNSCYSFNRPCHFYGTCDLQVLKGVGEAYEVLSKDAADLVINLQDLAVLVDTQDLDELDSLLT